MCTTGTSCGCGTATADSTPTAVEAVDGVRTTYTVSGMTCTGCANNVSKQIRTVEGVTGVEIDVASGTVAVSSAAPLETADVRAAVEKAGYQLVS